TIVLGGNLNLLNTNDLATGPTVVAGSAVNGVTSTVNGVTYNNFSAGALTLSLYGTLSSGNATIGQGGSITLDNNDINQPRFTNAAFPNVTFNSGSFTFVANNTPGAISFEQLGTVTLNSGQSLINVGFSSAPDPDVSGTSMRITTLVRNTGATVNFIG